MDPDPDPGEAQKHVDPVDPDRDSDVDPEHCFFPVDAVLWNRTYFVQFRFRFRLLKSYGSGSDF